MMRFVRPILALAALVAAMPAAADDGRRHVMTPTQKIDLIRDLPDIPAFERDGQYFDLGYIYPIHIMNGVSVATVGGGDAGYVLYHDDYYVRADAGIMSDLRVALGEDPTQGYTPPVASSTSRSSGTAADPWGANAAPDNTDGQPIASPPPRGSSARRGGGGGVVTGMIVLFFVLFLRFRAFRDLVIGGVLAAIAAIARRRAEPDFGSGMAVPNEMLASQAAAQRARLDGLSNAPANAAPGGFGRKQA